MSDHYDRYNGMENLLSTNLASLGTDCISRQAAIEIVNHSRFGMQKMTFDIITTALGELPLTQPTPDQNGDIWITVPDIDKVTRIFVQENKSKFCRIFYEER